MKNEESKKGDIKVFKDYESFRQFYFGEPSGRNQIIESGAASLGADLAKSTISELTQKASMGVRRNGNRE